MADTETYYGKSPATEAIESMKAFNRLPNEVQRKASAELGRQIAEYQHMNFGKSD